MAPPADEILVHFGSFVRGIAISGDGPPSSSTLPHDLCNRPAARIQGSRRIRPTPWTTARAWSTSCRLDHAAVDNSAPWPCGSGSSPTFRHGENDGRYQVVPAPGSAARPPYASPASYSRPRQRSHAPHGTPPAWRVTPARIPHHRAEQPGKPSRLRFRPGTLARATSVQEGTAAPPLRTSVETPPAPHHAFLLAECLGRQERPPEPQHASFRQIADCSVTTRPSQLAQVVAHISWPTGSGRTRITPFTSFSNSSNRPGAHGGLLQPWARVRPVC